MGHIDIVPPQLLLGMNLSLRSDKTARIGVIGAIVIIVVVLAVLAFFGVFGLHL